MKIYTLIFCLVFQFTGTSSLWSAESSADQPAKLPVSSLLGETLSYNVSFLWFKKIARGEIRLEPGEKQGTYLATLTARTRGMTAFFTRNRVETYTTLMEEGSDGLLRPLIQKAGTKKGKKGKETHRQTTYAFDFLTKMVHYEKAVNGVVEHVQKLKMEGEDPVYDFLTAFYNLRLGRLGAILPGTDIKLSAFSRKGPEKITIYRLFEDQQAKLKFSKDLIFCKVMMSSETFNTVDSDIGSDIYVGFDTLLRPQFAIVKNVIGLGDVKGELVNISSTLP